MFSKIIFFSVIFLHALISIFGSFYYLQEWVSLLKYGWNIRCKQFWPKRYRHSISKPQHEINGKCHVIVKAMFWLNKIHLTTCTMYNNKRMIQFKNTSIKYITIWQTKHFSALDTSKFFVKNWIYQKVQLLRLLYYMNDMWLHI